MPSSRPVLRALTAAPNKKKKKKIENDYEEHFFNKKKGNEKKREPSWALSEWLRSSISCNMRSISSRFIRPKPGEKGGGNNKKKQKKINIIVNNNLTARATNSRPRLAGPPESRQESASEASAACGPRHS
jgi:hypothetical protein